MIEISDYAIFTAIFLLLFLVTVILLDGYREWTIPFMKRNYSLLLEIPWDTLIKSFAAAGIFLYLRMLIPWRAENNALKALLILVSYFLLYQLVISYLRIRKGFMKEKPKTKRFFRFLGLVIVILIFVFLTSDKGVLTSFGQLVVYIIVAPVVVLMMLCSGKYVGFVTSFLVSYFIIYKYKKLKPIINKSNVIFLVRPVIIILILMFLSSVFFPGSGVEKLPGEVTTGIVSEAVSRIEKAGKQEKDFRGLIADVPSIKDDHVKFNTCKQLILQIDRADIPKKNKVYQQMIDVVKDIDIKYFRAELLMDLAVGIARSGDVQWALDVTNMIMIASVKFSTLIEIIAVVSESGEPEWVEAILPQAIDTAKPIKPRLDQANAFKKLALAAANSGNMKWAETIFQKALDTAKAIKYLETRDEAHRQIALALANTGNIQWAEEVAQLITGEKIKDKTLKKIHRIIEKND